MKNANKEIYNAISNKFNTLSCYNQHGIQSYSMRLSSDFIANNITKTFRHKNYYWISQQNYMTSFIHNDNLYLPLKMQTIYLTFILQAL